MRSKYPQIRRPATMPQPPRFITRTELEQGGVDVIASGNILDEEIDAAKSYHGRTGRKVWTINSVTGRTVFRLERAKAQAGGAH
jgi:hypothetical protein